MKTVLIDVNVIVDILLNRKPHVEASAAVWAAVESHRADGLLAAHAITTIHYLIRKELGAVRAKRAVSAMLRVFGIAAVDGNVIQDAVELSLTDFEDSVSAAAAQLARCDYIVTRDPRGFRGSPVPSVTPEAALPLLGAE